MAWIEIGPLADFAEGRGVAVGHGGRRLALFRLADEVFAVENRCPHRGFPLHDGSLGGVWVRCRTHGSTFDLTSGAVGRGPARCGIETFRVEIVDGIVRVEVPD